ncbi:unnamed protein product [Spirodela intermedia]|uniref:K Homology domain-containing protein n=1 Tax=Spirodela intermedia TaxID=51605 RepID=A0A7I8KPX7_SPIIN|nr:unnamed protein product [Spirodela intermedia]
MASKLDSTSANDSQLAQSPIAKSISTNSANSPKVSMFGIKSGFVIPKNKLSGSLVPIYRGVSKVDSGDVGKEENSKQVQRKTRWGVDLTQDASVRKGRSLAYQTRVEQITQQLKSGSLELGEDQGSQTPERSSNVDSVDQLNLSKSHNRESLELEKRELIGEILRLNPNYKAPPDYKPLLKEAKVPISVKAHPGYNFIGLILGPASNTQKRLEEETGAKVRVYGTKRTSREKCEITRSDAAEAQGIYDDLYVHILADTYEKVDAAVSLVELLVTPVFPIPAVSAGDGVDDANQSQKDSSVPAHSTVPVSVAYQGVVQPAVAPPAHAALPHFQPYPGPWPPHFPPYLTSAPSSSGFPPTSISQFPPPAVSGPESHNMQNFRPPLSQHTAPSGHGYPPMGPQAPQSTPQTRPTPMIPQSGPASPGGGFLYTSRPLTSTTPPLPQRPNTMFSMFPPSSIPPQMPHPVVQRGNAPFQPGQNFTPRPPFSHQHSSKAPSHAPAPAMGSSATPTFMPPGRVPSLSPRPFSVSSSASLPAITSPSPYPLVQTQTQPVPFSTTRPPVPVSSIAAAPSVAPPSQLTVPAVSGQPAMGGFFPLKPSVSVLPITSPKPQHLSLGDFTFQPHRASSPMPSPHSAPPNNPSPAAQLPPLFAPAPQQPSFRPAAPNLGMMMPGPLRQPPPASVGLPFSANPANMLASTRLPSFSNAGPLSSSQVDVGRNFLPAPPSGLPGSAPSRAAALIQAHGQQGPSPPVRPPHGYVPFSPISIPPTLPRPQGGGGDPEYEDLMASVGVK